MGSEITNGAVAVPVLVTVIENHAKTVLFMRWYRATPRVFDSTTP
jgi:hypothetical protein